MNEIDRTPISEILKAQIENTDEKDEASYWEPFSEIIMECIEVRSVKDLSQKEIAERMGTRQSVISRFENMGRKPNYDFLSRLSIALGQKLGLTLFGDFMAVVSLQDQELIKELSEKEKLDTKEYTQLLLEKAISIERYNDECRKAEMEVIDTVQSNSYLLDSLNSDNQNETLHSGIPDEQISLIETQNRNDNSIIAYTKADKREMPMPDTSLADKVNRAIGA